MGRMMIHRVHESHCGVDTANEIYIEKEFGMKGMRSVTGVVLIFLAGAFLYHLFIDRLSMALLTFGNGIVFLIWGLNMLQGEDKRKVQGTAALFLSVFAFGLFFVEVWRGNPIF